MHKLYTIYAERNTNAKDEIKSCNSESRELSDHQTQSSTLPDLTDFSLKLKKNSWTVETVRSVIGCEERVFMTTP